MRKSNITVQVFLLCIYCCYANDQLEDLSFEELYHKTVKSWKSQHHWQPWKDYTGELIRRWGDEKDSNRIEILGGLEEGILAIEKATVARGQGENIQRDIMLSELYCAYGRTLLEVDASGCHKLASDPHTLLMGIETLSEDDKPSTYLCIQNAENALRNAVTLDATNTRAEKLLEEITGDAGVHLRKPKEFVAELFDSFAETFDEKLVNGLGYTVPKLVGDAAKLLRREYGSVLDAGCGTGLAGRHLKPLAKDLMVGVDASQKMLDIAAKCTTHTGCGVNERKEINQNKGVVEVPLYNDLLVLDLEEMTLKNTLNRRSKSVSRTGFDLIVAADVLVYFGSISNLLQTFAKISNPDAVLIFSCEHATDEEAPLGWRLLSSGRFSHTKSHALEAASSAGYELVSYEKIVPRMEKGEEVRGHMFGFVLNAGTEHTEL